MRNRSRRPAANASRRLAAGGAVNSAEVRVRGELATYLVEWRLLETGSALAMAFVVAPDGTRWMAATAHVGSTIPEAVAETVAEADANLKRVRREARIEGR